WAIWWAGSDSERVLIGVLPTAALPASGCGVTGSVPDSQPSAVRSPRERRRSGLPRFPPQSTPLGLRNLEAFPLRTIECAMGSQIWKQAATPPVPSRGPAPGRAALPPVLVEAGAKRLAPVALLAAGIQVFFAVVERTALEQQGVAPVSRTLWLA